MARSEVLSALHRAIGLVQVTVFVEHVRIRLRSIQQLLKYTYVYQQDMKRKSRNGNYHVLACSCPARYRQKDASAMKPPFENQWTHHNATT